MKKVMIVEDDEGIMEAMQAAFEMEGYETLALTNAKHVMTHITEWKPDIIILDYLLSGMNGKEICSEIKTSKATSAIPVIMLSAHPNAKNEIGTCADAFMPKPFDLFDLIHRADELIR
jgi:DNA-binding response OmpR family regulator